MVKYVPLRYILEAMEQLENKKIKISQKGL